MLSDICYVATREQQMGIRAAIARGILLSLGWIYIIAVFNTFRVAIGWKVEVLRRTEGSNTMMRKLTELHLYFNHAMLLPYSAIAA